MTAIERAKAKRLRIAERRRWERCGAPVWSKERRERLREDRWRNIAAQHGHAHEDGCERCTVTSERMRKRGTA